MLYFALGITSIYMLMSTHLISMWEELPNNQLVTISREIVNEIKKTKFELNLNVDLMLSVLNVKEGFHPDKI